MVRMMTKTRPNGKVVVHTEKVPNLTKEEVILILEVVSMVIFIDVVNNGIDPLNVDPMKVRKVT